MNWNCGVSAFFFFVGTILYLVHQISVGYGGMTPQFAELDPAYLKVEWERRRAFAVVESVCHWSIVLAWLFLSIPILQLCWLLSFQGTRRVGLHTTIVVLCLGACLTEMMALLFSIGMDNMLEFMTLEMNLTNWMLSTGSSSSATYSIAGSRADNLGWRAMEIVMLITRGMTLWVEAFEYLALFVMFTSLYKSMISLSKDNAHTPFTFGPWMAHLGLLIAFLSLADFSTQIVRTAVGSKQWQFYNILAKLLGMINRLVFLPLYLCCLGKQLSVATHIIERNHVQSQQPQPEVSFTAA